MKIKEKQTSPTAQKLSRLYRNKKLTFIMAVLGSVGLVVFLFFATLGYGAYLKKSEKTTYFKNTLLRIADLDFSFLKNFKDGMMADIDRIDLDIKFKHLTRIHYLREQMLQKGTGYIDEALKDEDFPATLTFNGESHEVKVGLTGKVARHIIDPNKWSFEVKVKGDDTINGMKRFGVLIPSSRGFLTDWTVYELMKERGLIALRMDYVDVNINGKPAGVFYLEERFDKHLVENNRLREGIIFKLERDMSVYQEDKLLESPEKRDHLLLLNRLWQEVTTGQLPPEKFFDMEKMAKLYAISDLMNNRHGLLRDNLRFYFNPVTGLVEPIAREWESLETNDPSDLSVFLEDPPYGSRHYWLKEDKVNQLVFDNFEFQRHYIQELEIISQKELLDHILERNGDKIAALTKKIYRNWPFYEYPAQILYDNQLYLREIFFPDVVNLAAFFKESKDRELSIQLENRGPLPLEVSYLSLSDSVFFYPKEAPVILPSASKNQKNEVRFYDFQIPADLAWSDTLLPTLRINYNLLGLAAGEKKVFVNPWAYDQHASNFRNPAVREATHQTFDFIEEQEADVVLIPAGNWTVDHDLIIPRNKRFKINAGARLDLVNHSQIISYAPISSVGTEAEPVVITSSDVTGKGITVIRANAPSDLSYTVVENLSHPTDQGWSLTGALTFYESPVSIRYCRFAKNRLGDDFLNIIRSEFSIDQTVFEDINADAFDCDFCKGTITESSFNNIGNDGIDVSGTEMEIWRIVMNNIGDKGLSAGENSQVTAKWLDISNAEIGITSKDRSTIELENAQLLNSRIGFTIFQKKSEFGPAAITARTVSIDQSEIPFLIEKNSTMILDGRSLPADQENVTDLLYGVQYGKSSG